MTAFSRWPAWRRWFGRRAERAAAKYLRRQRMRILAANLDDRLGEIDLLALDAGVLVIVEVRSTATDDLDRAAASVDLRKQRRLTEAAVRFLARAKLLGHPARFDVLAVSWPPGREPVFAHHRHAFEATGRFQFWS